MEYLLIEENKYHINCFVCGICEEDLSRELYAKSNGIIICSKWTTDLFADLQFWEL